MRFLAIVLFSFQCSQGLSQDTSYVRTMIDSLCASHYDGRGYVNSGEVRAAHFIIRELRKLGVEEEPEIQEFTLGVNTFPGAMALTLNDRILLPGIDFIINPKSKAFNGSFKASYFNPEWVEDSNKLSKLIVKGKFSDRFIIMPEVAENEKYQGFLTTLATNPLKCSGYIVLTDKKLTWTVGRVVMDVAIFQVRAAALNGRVKKGYASVEQEFISECKAENIVFKLQGTDKANEKQVVFTAHLDHLGRMGAETFIPGANDNASGSAMLLDLYKYYRQNPPPFSLVFIWFAGEEAGLVGSNYYVEHPYHPLEKIKFLINLDLMGDAKSGITVVNGKIFTEQFAKLSSLNAEMSLLDQIKARGPAANSDHHPFYEKGVPSFFIYTTGDYVHYHDVQDKPENLPLTNYTQVFNLITEFVALGL